MKAISTFLLAALACVSSMRAAEPTKPELTLAVKRQLLDSEHDMHGRQGSSQHKTSTLRVEITNISPATVSGAVLSGKALVMRARMEEERVVSEPLGELKVPDLKPNERLTLDLGTIRLSEVETRNRKFEETLEEWQVVCTRGEVNLAKAESSERFAKLAAEVVPEKAEGAGAGKGKKKRQGK